MRAKHVLITLGVGVLVLVAAAVFVGPSLIQDTVESELEKRLKNRGIDATWTSFSSAWGKSFEIRDLEVHLPDKGIELKSRRAVVTLALDGLLDGEPRLKSVHVDGPSIDFDLAAQRSSDPVDDPAGPASNKEGLLQKLMRDPPDIDVTDATVRIFNDDELIASGTSPETTVTVGDRIELFASGIIALESPRFGVLRAQKFPVGIEVSASRDATSVEFGMSGADDAHLFNWADDQAGELRILALSGEANLQTRSGVFTASDLVMRVGDKVAPAVAMESPTVSLGRKDARNFVRLDEPRFSVAPSRRGELREALSGPTKEHKPSTRTSSRNARWFQRAATLFDATDITLVNASLELFLEGEEEGEFNALTPLERFDIKSRKGHVTGRAETAGGWIKAESAVVPGRSIPLYVAIDVVDVDLGKIPGMPEQRSELPSRGTSGRVAGVVNAHMAMAAPSLGVGPAASPFDAVSGVVNLKWTDGVIDLTGVSEDALERINVETSFDFKWKPILGEVEVSDGRMDYGPVDIEFTAGVSDWPIDTTFEIKAEMQEIECQRAFRALPNGLLGPYRRIEIDGKWAPKVYFKLPIYEPRKLRLKVEDYEDLCTIEKLRVPKRYWPDVSIKAVAPTGPHATARPVPEGVDPGLKDDVFWMNRPFVKHVTEGVSDPENSQVYVGPGLASYVPFDELPPWVPASAYLSEQMLFYDDPPVSLGLIRKALRLNLERGRFVYGGSTVTQQLVKNLVFSRDKTLSRKLQEALFSWRVTQMVSKKRVLELYVNCIEFGPDVYGIGPAARYYFQKDARDLTPKESLFLAMLKPAPWYGAKVVERKKTPVSGYWGKRTAELYQRLLDKGYVTEAQIEADKPHFLEWDENGRYKPSYKPKTPEAPKWVPLDL